MVAGRFFLSGFSGTKVSNIVKKLILDHDLAGVVLFAKNGTSLTQLQELISELKGLKSSVSKDPLIVAVDYEGGFVQRFQGIIPDIISPAAISKAGEATLETVYSFMAEKLKEIGVNLCFAPVLDVLSDFSDYIGIRSFGSLEEVLRFGVKAAMILQEQGIASCCKHFPGLGSTKSDSHFSLPSCHLKINEIEADNLRPFAEAAKAGALSMMTAHCIYHALDHFNPATFSERINISILRKELNFKGLLISDDLVMAGAGGVDNLYSSVKKARLSGVDLIMACHCEEKLLEVIQEVSGDNEFLNFNNEQQHQRFRLFYEFLKKNESKRASKQIDREEFENCSKEAAIKAIEFFNGNPVMQTPATEDVFVFSDSIAFSGVEENFKSSLSGIIAEKKILPIKELKTISLENLQMTGFFGDLSQEELNILKEFYELGGYFTKVFILKNLNNLEFIRQMAGKVISLSGWTYYNQLAIKNLLSED